MSARATGVAACEPASSASCEASARVGDRMLMVSMRLAALLERARQRRRLRVLAADPAFLKDVGISRADALREASKPAWRP